MIENKMRPTLGRMLFILKNAFFRLFRYAYAACRIRRSRGFSFLCSQKRLSRNLPISASGMSAVSLKPLTGQAFLLAYNLLGNGRNSHVRRPRQRREHLASNVSGFTIRRKSWNQYILYDYRGYGESTGSPSIANFTPTPRPFTNTSANSRALKIIK